MEECKSKEGHCCSEKTPTYHDPYNREWNKGLIRVVQGRDYWVLSLRASGDSESP